MDVLVAAAGSLWLSIDQCGWVGHSHSGWLVGWLVGAAHCFVGWQARMGSSCAVVLSTILVAVSQNCVVGQPASQWLGFFWLAKSVGVKKKPKTVGFTEPPK
jgi:hypothetical protein